MSLLFTGADGGQAEDGKPWLDELARPAVSLLPRFLSLWDTDYSSRMLVQCCCNSGVTRSGCWCNAGDVVIIN